MDQYPLRLISSATSSNCGSPASKQSGTSPPGQYSRKPTGFVVDENVHETTLERKSSNLIRTRGGLRFERSSTLLTATSSFISQCAATRLHASTRSPSALAEEVPSSSSEQVTINNAILVMGSPPAVGRLAFRGLRSLWWLGAIFWRARSIACVNCRPEKGQSHPHHPQLGPVTKLS